MTVPPNGSNPIIEENGTMTQAFRSWVQAVNRSIPLTGTGSPEGVVDALQFQTYFDESGATGTIIYVKMQADIAGDKTKGWVLA